MAKSAALGDSPNPFFNVYRSYMEPGGIADEMKATAAANPDVMKLEQIGTSTLGKPIYAHQDDRRTRATCPTARATRSCSPPSTTRASGSPPRWAAACRSGSPSTRTTRRSSELIQTRELWFLPIQNPDGYDFTFTCGLGAAQVPCDYRVRTADDNRFWRKTLRDNNANGIYGDSQDGVDPNRNYPAKRGIDEEGASNSFGSETYRGPYALSEPENLAVDRLQRRVPFKANINWHSSGQLLLTPVSYTTDYYPPDSTLFDAITGTDGDEAVFPYRSQHSSDLYESNGDTIDNAYHNYGIIGWTPEMDTCATMGEPSGCNSVRLAGQRVQGQRGVREEPLVRAQRDPLAAEPRRVRRTSTTTRATTRSRPRRTSSPTASMSPTARTQVVEATIRKELGDADITVSVVGQNGNVTIPMTPAPAGERYNEVKGYYFERRQATFPGIDRHPCRAGRRHRQRGRQGRRPAAGVPLPRSPRCPTCPRPASRPRSACWSSPPRTTPASRRTSTPGYATAPRYLAQHVAALEAAGYEVETFNIDAPPANGGSPNPVQRPQIKYPTNLGVMSHFDAVNYYTGDDFIPQEADGHQPAALLVGDGADRLAGDGAVGAQDAPRAA